MEKIYVNHDACIGCGACVAIDPEHFEFDDNGLSQAKNNDNLASSELRNAMESCPTSAISLVEGTEEHCGCHECEESCECNCNSCECGCNCQNECEAN